MKKPEGKASSAGSRRTEKNQLAENQVVFRRHNEKIQKGFDDLMDIASEERESSFVSYPDSVLYYLCECSDENCRKRIKLKFDEYNKIHKKRNRFVIIPGHEFKHIEKVVENKAEFSIVEKFSTATEDVEKLSTTSANNK